MIHISYSEAGTPIGPNNPYFYTNNPSITAEDIVLPENTIEYRCYDGINYGYTSGETVSGEKISVYYFCIQNKAPLKHADRIENIMKSLQAKKAIETDSVVAITLNDTDFAKKVLSQRKKRKFTKFILDGAVALVAEGIKSNNLNSLVEETKKRIKTVQVGQMPIEEIDGTSVESIVFENEEAREKGMETITSTTQQISTSVDIIIGFIYQKR